MTSSVARVLMGVLLAGCAVHPPPPSGPQADVLILAPQGVHPDLDTVGYNDLVRRVTQAFASELAGGLQTRHASFISVLDQNPAHDTGQKLALHSTRHSSGTAIVLTVEAETLGNDERLLLRVQHVHQKLRIEQGVARGVSAISTVEKSYLLRSSISGDNPAGVAALADDFLAFLKQHGRL